MVYALENSVDGVKKTVEIVRLLDIYGRLLTEQQYEIMSDYYNLNLSLSEISENRKISRTAVSDALSTATKKLSNFEEKVKICKVFDANKTSKTADIINKLEEDIKNGI
mgnify:CR=1 FL=1